jgi:hypothetical protein
LDVTVVTVEVHDAETITCRMYSRQDRIHVLHKQHAATRLVAIHARAMQGGREMECRVQMLMSVRWVQTTAMAMQHAPTRTVALLVLAVQDGLAMASLARMKTNAVLVPTIVM